MRAGAPDVIRGKAFEALKSACSDETLKPLIRKVFGGDGLSEGLAPGYDSLKKALEMATSRGLFD